MLSGALPYLLAGAGVVLAAARARQLMRMSLAHAMLSSVVVRLFREGNADRAKKLLRSVRDTSFARMISAALAQAESVAPSAGSADGPAGIEAGLHAAFHDQYRREMARIASTRFVAAGSLALVLAAPTLALVTGPSPSAWLWAICGVAVALLVWAATVARRIATQTHRESLVIVPELVRLVRRASSPPPPSPPVAPPPPPRAPAHVDPSEWRQEAAILYGFARSPDAFYASVAALARGRSLLVAHLRDRQASGQFLVALLGPPAALQEIAPLVAAGAEGPAPEIVYTWDPAADRWADVLAAKSAYFRVRAEIAAGAFEVVAVSDGAE